MAEYVICSGVLWYACSLLSQVVQLMSNGTRCANEDCYHIIWESFISLSLREIHYILNNLPASFRPTPVCILSEMHGTHISIFNLSMLKLFKTLRFSEEMLNIFSFHLHFSIHEVVFAWHKFTQEIVSWWITLKERPDDVSKHNILWEKQAQRTCPQIRPKLKPLLRKRVEILAQRCYSFREKKKKAWSSQTKVPTKRGRVSFFHRRNPGAWRHQVLPQSFGWEGHHREARKDALRRLPLTLLWSCKSFFKVFWGLKASFFQAPTGRWGLIEPSWTRALTYLFLPTQFSRQNSWCFKCGLKRLNVAFGWRENYSFPSGLSRCGKKLLEACKTKQDRTEQNSNTNCKSGEKEMINLVTLENPLKMLPVRLRYSIWNLVSALGW